MINQLVNQRYEAIEKAGEGPLFTVYKARDQVANRIVAIKALNRAYVADVEFVAGIRNGAETAALLKHPNIVAVIDYGVEDSTPYLVTEFVRGINLKERIRRIAPFTLSVAVDFSCAVAEALHYAHSVGQVHGDLRPQNVIVSPEGAVKVSDFGVQNGIARSSAAQIDILKRSAPYHAPELSVREMGSIPGDIYALGAILYEMLTGAPPYTADNPDGLADQHAFAPIPSPREINPGVPRSIEGIVVKCLQKRPDLRYATAAELLADLKSVRDALRFGKSLSWSPIDLEKQPEPVAQRRETLASPPPSRTMEPVAEAAASSQAATMNSMNRLRAEEEKISVYIKVALSTVIVIIIACLLGVYSIYLRNWVMPPPVAVPPLEGRSIEDVRKLAQQMNIHLIEHSEYVDNPRGYVYRTDQERGAMLRPNHALNVWFSKGPEYVNVPNVVNMQRDDAERILTDAGLRIGRVTPEYSEKIAINFVASQDLSEKKRVLHDSVVDLIVSDGPKPDFAAPVDGQQPDETGNNTTGNGTNPTPGANGDAGTGSPTTGGTPDTPDNTVHHFDRPVIINKDGMGQRRVRVEYTDAQGSHPAVIDEMHYEGDTIPLKFDYTGGDITLNIYYDDKLKFSKRFNPDASRKETIN